MHLEGIVRNKQGSRKRDEYALKIKNRRRTNRLFVSDLTMHFVLKLLAKNYITVVELKFELENLLMRMGTVGTHHERGSDFQFSMGAGTRENFDFRDGNKDCNPHLECDH